jgi:hypothetical protein
MTHAAVYGACAASRCVIHIPSRSIFDGMLRDGAPSTPREAEYGTPQMARAVAALVRELSKAGAPGEGALVMAGHDEGVIAWADSVKNCEKIVKVLDKKYRI